MSEIPPHCFDDGGHIDSAGTAYNRTRKHEGVVPLKPCGVSGPHGSCSLWLPPTHDGTHYSYSSECVWDDQGNHFHDGRTVE